MANPPAKAPPSTLRRVLWWVVGIPAGFGVYIGVASWLRHGQDLPYWVAFGWPVIGLAGLFVWLAFQGNAKKKKR